MIYTLGMILGICQRVAKITHALLNTLVHESVGEVSTKLYNFEKQIYFTNLVIGKVHSVQEFHIKRRSSQASKLR